MIAHIFQIEKHKNIENYAFNFIKFLFENLNNEELEGQIFYFSYFEDEEYKDSILERLNLISFPKDKIRFYSDHISMMNNIKDNNYHNNIFHQLSSIKIFIYLFKNYRLIKKTSWMIWGGDLYNVFINKLSFKYKIYDLIVRKFVILNLKNIIGFKGDYNLLKSRYSTNAKYFFALYNMPSKIYSIDEVSFEASKVKKILIAHSANGVNNHEEIFDKLIPYKNENIELICPLSYGDLANVNNVEKKRL
jgi:hypothetical protein